MTETIAPSTTSAAAAATSSAATSGGTSTSAIVGGIAGGLVGVAGLIFLVMFIMRRYRKHDEDEDSPFDANDFRRQSAILIDDDQASMGGNGRRGARPPTMIERHMANTNTFDAPPMPSLQQYQQYNDMPAGMAGMAGAGMANAYDGNGYDSRADYGNGSGYPAHNNQGGLTRQPSFSPGQIVSPTSPPPVHGAGYADLSRTPSFDQYGLPMQTDLARQPSMGMGYPDMNLSRQNSMAQQQQSNLGVQQHYGDSGLDRSSVTPFQAQQYAEIHQRLNLDQPNPSSSLRAVNEDEEQGPFTDYNDAPEPFDPSGRGSVDEDEPHALPNPFGNDDLTPPSPVYSMNPKSAGTNNASRDRIVSQPPSLPELNRSFSPISPSSYDFPQTPNMAMTPTAARANPSPLNNTFAPAEVAVPRPAERAPQSNAQRPVSTHTVYDEADAYGGF